MEPSTHLRPSRLARASAATLAVVAASVSVGDAASSSSAGAEPAAGAAQASEYRFAVGKPVLTYSRGRYSVVFRLDRDFPRDPTNRRIRGTLDLNGARSISIGGGNRFDRCYTAAVERGSDLAGEPRFGQLYTVVVTPLDAASVTTRVRLRRATRGFRSEKASRDPKARDLRCKPRARR